MVRLPPGTEAVTLEWRNAYGSQPLDFREVEVCCLTAEADRQTPRGAVGLVAADVGQFPELLADIVEHYAHYRQTAAGMARRWTEWNNPARVLAERVMKQQDTTETRLAFAWRLAAARPPSAAERKILRSALEHHHAHYRENRPAALKLVSNKNATQLELIIEKRDGHIRTLSSVRSDGSALIKDGRFVASGADTAAQERCY